MAYQLFSRVALKEDLPAHGLQSGDVATIVETHSGEEHQEPGYSLEVFNAIGETIAVVTYTNHKSSRLRLTRFFTCDDWTKCWCDVSENPCTVTAADHS